MGRLRIVKRAPSKKDANTLPSMGPGKCIEESTARQILASQLEQVAGPPPIRGGALVVVAAIGVAVVAIAYSLASI